MAVAYVQSTSNTAHSASSAAKAFTSNNTAGNLLLVAVGVWKSGSFNDPTIADSQGNTWVLLLTTSRLGLSGQSCAYLFAAYNCKAGANTVTVTVGTSSDIDIAIHEYSGVATVTARDQIAAGSQTTVSSILAGTVQTQHANEVIFSFAYDQSHGSQTFTPSAGWTARQQTTNPGSESSATYDQLVSSTGTFTNTISVSGGSSNGLHAIIATFADASTTDALVQSAKSSNNSTTSFTVAFPANNTSGNLLLLAIGRFSSGTLGTITSVTDSQGNTWTLIGSTPLQNSSGDSEAHLYACGSCAAGANTVTVAISTSTSQDMTLIALEYTPHTIDSQVSNSGTTGGGGPTSVGSGSLLATSLAFSLAFNQSSASAGNYSDFSGTGWRQRVNESGAVLGGTALSTFDQILPAASTIEQTVTSQVISRGLHVLIAAKGSTIQPIMMFLIS